MIGAYIKHDDGHISWLSDAHRGCDHSKRPDKSFLVKDDFFFIFEKEKYQFLPFPAHISSSV